MRPEPVAPTAEKVSKTTGATAAAVTPRDEVHVSARAEQLASGADRVEELRAAVRNGTFKIDASAIAARLVGDDFEGGGR